MAIEWGTTAVEVGIGVISLIGGMKIKAARQDERFVTVFNRLDSSDKRHDGHDARIDKVNEELDDLPNKFVPRTEIEVRLKAIDANTAATKEATDETKRLINWLVFYRAQQQPSPGPLPVAPAGPNIPPTA